MRLCPKCRSYFDDSLLRFCKNDGTPLLELNQTSELWSDGTEYIRETTKQIKREIRRSQIKKIVSFLITTIIITSVISVITLNSWIYTHPIEVAEIRGEKTVEKETIVESKPQPQQSPIIIESIPLDSTPLPADSPRKDIPENVPGQKLTPILTRSPTPTPTPTPTPNRTLIVKNQECTASMKEQAKIDILSTNTGEINQGVGNLEKPDAFNYYKERHPAGVKPENLFNRGSISVTVNTCTTATAVSKSEWLPTTDHYLKGVTPFTGTKTFSCNNKNKTWKCTYIK